MELTPNPLTPKQLRELRLAAVGPAGNRVGAAMALAGLTQAQVADGMLVAQPYVSDVARGRHATITLENARKFAVFFGCDVDDLFPAKAQVA
jgi:transcriptional regulator with XRE-family HTH domain